MSTITCTNFLPRVQLSPYEEGRFLLTAHGPFLELYDLDKFHTDDFKARECEPIRTHFFEKNRIKNFVVLESGHVLALSSNHEKNKLTIQGCIVPRDLILGGGYTDKSSIHCLVEEPSRTDAFFTAVIPRTNEVLLLTEFTLTHFQFDFEDDSNVICDVIEKFELQTLLSPLYCNKSIDPLAIDSSREYSIILSVGGSIVLLKYSSRENKWACRAMQDPKGSLLDFTRAMVIPEMEMAVIAGKYYVKFISTSFRQPGVSKDQIRVLHEEYKKEKIRAMTCSSRDGLVYLLRNWDLNVRRVHKQIVTHERTFIHKEDEKLQEMVNKQLAKEKAEIRKEEGKLSFTSFYVHNSKQIHTEPISAMLMEKKTGGSIMEILIISYASGGVKVVRTSDIIKDTVCTYVHLGVKNMPIENLYPCWEFPLDPLIPLTRLIGLSNGIPMLFKLKNGSWNVSELLPSSNSKYSHVCSNAAKFGYTIAVFYNRNNICFCFFNDQIDWKEDQLNCEIKGCYINSTTIVIITREKILLLDVRGSLTTDGKEGLYCASLDFATIGVPAKEMFKGVESAICRKREGEDQGFDTYIQFKCGQMRTVPMKMMDKSREYSIQEIFDSEFEGRVEGMGVESSTTPGQYTIGVIIDERGGNFSLKKDGTVCRVMERIGESNTNDITTIKLEKDLPEDAQLMGFIPIQTTKADEERIFVLARSERGDLLYLQDAAGKKYVISEPVPCKFWNSHIFGHFVGEKERCVLYSASSRKYGEPELMRVEVKVNDDRIREFLVFDGSLSQQNKVLRLVQHNDKKAIIVSTYANKIELHELSSKGRITMKKVIELMNEKEEPIVINSFDTYFLHSSNTLYIATASLSGDLALITWDVLTTEHKCENTTTQYELHNLYFMCNENSGVPPSHIASFNDTFMMLYDVSSNSPKEIGKYPIGLVIRSNDVASYTSNDNKILVACNGDGIDVNDIWMVSKKEAIRFWGRRDKLMQNIRKYTSSSWPGELKLLSFLTSRNGAVSGPYANFVFVVKDKSRIGILASMQTTDQPPTTILFEELTKIARAKTIAIHGELLHCSAQGEDKIDVTIRLFIAGNRKISIMEIIASITSTSLQLLELTKLGKIGMTTTDPSHIVVTRMEERKDRSTPKYAIVSGSEGTEIVRICESKLRR